MNSSLELLEVVALTEDLPEAGRIHEARRIAEGMLEREETDRLA